MQIRFEVKGHKDVEAALKALGHATASRLGLNAAMAGARVLAAAARLRAPVGETGELKRSIRATSDRRNQKPGEALASVVTDVFYAKFLELGTSRMPAQPFMRPAVDVAAPEAVAKVGDNLGAGIERTVAQRGRG